MDEKKTSTDGFQWIYNKYIGDDPERVASFQEELFKLQIAQEIYDLRDHAGITQAQLAEQVGTKPSVIEDIEAADYESEHLEAIFRVATLFGKKIEIRFVPLAKDDSAKLEAVRRPAPETADVVFSADDAALSSGE